MPDVKVVTFPTGSVVPVDPVLAVYADVYAEAPYFEGRTEVDAFADTWLDRAMSPGFRIVLARDGVRVVGFAFGVELQPDTRWWSGALGPLDVDVAEWPGRTFAVIELAVLPAYRRQGIATRLLAELLAEVKAERVTLAVRPEPEAAPARALYERAGYRKVGQVRPGPGLPVYDLMVAELGTSPQ